MPSGPVISQAWCMRPERIAAQQRAFGRFVAEQDRIGARFGSGHGAAS